MKGFPLMKNRDFSCAGCWDVVVSFNMRIFIIDRDIHEAFEIISGHSIITCPTSIAYIRKNCIPVKFPLTILWKKYCELIPDKII